jgi:hypothetical protein
VIGEDEPAPSDLKAAEADLARAKARLADLESIADGLKLEVAARNGSRFDLAFATQKVLEAPQAVVVASPTVRRMAEDYKIARRTYETYHSALRWLAGKDCIPADLKDAAPKRHEAYAATSTTTTPIPNPSLGPPIRTKSSPPSDEGIKC